MIRTVSAESSTWDSPPGRFEAGTPNVAGAVGLAAAVAYLGKIGMKNVERHERALAKACRETLGKIPQMRLHGPEDGVGIVSFNVGKIHAHDIGQFADAEGIAIRAGHHCAQPLMKELDEAATARASFYVYNTEEEAERLALAAGKAQQALG